MSEEYPLVSETGKRYYLRIAEQPSAKVDVGDAIRVYESGAEYNETQKCLVAAPPANRIKNAEQGRELANRKWELYDERRQNAILEAVQEYGFDAMDIAEADEYVTKALVRETVLSSEVPAGYRGANWERLWQHAGLLRPKGKAVTNIGEVNILNVNTMDRGVSQAILQRLYGDDNNYYQKQSASQVEDNPPIEAEFEPSNDEE